jgi:hypothetical protein
MDRSITENFIFIGNQNFHRYLGKLTFWWGQLGSNINNRFFFWKLDNITTEKLNLLGLSPTTASNDWINRAIYQVQPDLIFDAPMIPDFIDSNDIYLVLANEKGHIVVYKDGNTNPIINNVLKETKIEEVEIHGKYLIVELYDNKIVFGLENFSRNGEIFIHEEDDPSYSGKYMIEQGHEYDKDNPTGLIFYDLDNLREKGHSIPERFVNMDFSFLESQGKIICYDEYSGYEDMIRERQLIISMIDNNTHREFYVNGIDQLRPVIGMIDDNTLREFYMSQLKQLPRDETLNKEKHMFCYDINQSRFLWQFTLGNYRPKHIYDLEQDKFLVISQSPSHSHILYKTTTGQILEILPYNSLPECQILPEIIPIIIPGTNDIKYIILSQ